VLSGASYRQIHYWGVLRYLRPVFYGGHTSNARHGGSGSGKAYRYDRHDLDVARFLVHVLDNVARRSVGAPQSKSSLEAAVERVREGGLHGTVALDSHDVVFADLDRIAGMYEPD
jgi:hypothetical protein